MNSGNDENLTELFERFVGPEQAQKAIADIRKVEQTFREHPAPVPHPELISSVKAKVTHALAHTKPSKFRRIACKLTAAAAVFLVLAAIGINVFDKDPEVYQKPVASLISASIWESEDIAADDADLASLTAEIEEVEGLLLALRLGENGGNESTDLTELEIEFIETNSDFWKG